MILRLAKALPRTGMFLLLVAILVAAQPARAVSLLRDADLEHALKQLAEPILRAAGLGTARVKVLIVDDNTLNAFVVGPDAIFLHAGLIDRLDRAAQLQAVIAHETAHIVNGHLTRRVGNLAAARTAAGLGIALAAAVAAAGAPGDAAAGIALGVQGSAQRLFFKHTRAEESSADQTALQLMRSAGADPSGLLEVFEIFRGQEVLAEHRQDPYMRSHPLSRDRLRAVTAAIGSQAAPRDDPAASYWFARARGKLSAWQRAPKWTLRRIARDPFPDIRAMREAVALHRQSQTGKALAALDGALAQRPKDAFLHDLRGEILMESRDFDGAVAAYARAVTLAPHEPLILSGYGRALMASARMKEALAALEKARSMDFRDGHMLRDLASAYAQTGQTGMAALITAERYALQNRLDDAGIHAKRATDLLPEGSGPWQRAQDVLFASERHAKQRKR